MIQGMLMKIYKMTLRPIAHALARPINTRRLRNSLENVSQFKNKHRGERCFIIGNGPSLDPNDLNRLNDEICFGTNGIYNIYSKTSWRPTYYFVTDKNFIYKNRKIIEKQNIQNKFIGITETFPCPSLRNVHYIREIDENFYPELPKFSDDMEFGIYGGGTVTYACIQFAIYTGVKEIFLLGVDHNYSVSVSPDGKLIKQEGVKDHFDDKDKSVCPPSLHAMELAYESAKQYADSHGIKIYNATRGGKLEVFERVDFDTLFN